MSANTDLPEGFRWATADETEAFTSGADMPFARVIPRTVDSEGRPYTHGEADVAVPAEVRKIHSILVRLKGDDATLTALSRELGHALAHEEGVTIHTAGGPYTVDVSHVKEC